DQWHRDHRVEVKFACDLFRDLWGLRVADNRHKLQHLPCDYCFSYKRPVIQWHWITLSQFLKPRVTLESDEFEHVVGNEDNNGKTSAEQSEQIPQDRLEHGASIGNRAAKRGKYFGVRGFPQQRLVALAGKPGDHRFLTGNGSAAIARHIWRIAMLYRC